MVETTVADLVNCRRFWMTGSRWRLMMGHRVDGMPHGAGCCLLLRSRRRCRTIEPQKANGWNRVATILNNRFGGFCCNASLPLNGDMPIRIVVACTGEKLAVRVVGPQGQKLEHDVIAAQINGEVQRCLVQHVAGIDVRTTAEGFLGTNERPTVDGIKEGGCRVHIHAGMAVVAIIGLGTGQGGRRGGAAGILAGLGLFLCVHGILLCFSFVRRLRMGPVGENCQRGSGKTYGKSETGQE